MMKSLIVLLILMTTAPAFATTDTFQQGVSSYTGSHAARIDSAFTNQHSTGTSGVIAVADSGAFGILYFDVSSIDSGATVSDASLELYVNEEGCAAETVFVRVIENPDSSGAPDFAATESDFFNDYATWAYKDHGATTDWDTANSNDFTDVDDNANLDTAAASACPGREKMTFDITSAVSTWVADANDNGGLMVGCTDSCSLKFVSPFDATTAERPKLTVTYTAGGGGGGGDRRIW